MQLVKRWRDERFVKPRTKLSSIGDREAPSRQRLADALLLVSPHGNIDVRVRSRESSQKQIDRPTAGDRPANIARREQSADARNQWVDWNHAMLSRLTIAVIGTG